MMLSVAVLGLFLRVAEAVVARDGVVTDGLLVAYEFSLDDCLTETFTDTAGFVGPLTRLTAKCRDVGGVMTDDLVSGGRRVVSEGNVSGVVQAMDDSIARGSDGFSVEFWVTLKSSGWKTGDPRQKANIMTFGTVDDLSGRDECQNQPFGINYIEEMDVNLIWRQGFEFMYQWTGLEGYVGEVIAVETECIIFRKYLPLEYDVPTHIVFSFGQIMNVYQNGVRKKNSDILRARRPYVNQMYSESWGSDEWGELRLELMGADGKSGFNADLHALRIYDRKITEIEANTNMRAGIFTSIAVVRDFNATIKEDEMINATTGQRGGKVVLDVGALNDIPGGPNYYRFHNSTNGSMYSKVYVSSLPTEGGVLVTDEGEIVSLPYVAPRDPETGEHYVYINTPQDAHEGDGSFETIEFTFYVVDGLEGLQSPTATASVTVEGVNDVPIAVAFDHLVTEGLTSTVTVAATDVDVGDVATMDYNVTTLPTSVTLYQVSTNGTVGAVIGLGDLLLTTKVAFRISQVEAAAMGPINATTGVFGTDYFEYVATDSSGARSAPAKVSISVGSAVVGAPSEPQVALEEVKTRVTLYGGDLSETPAAFLCFRVLGLPKEGLVNEEGLEAALQVGDVIVQRSGQPYTVGVNLEYIGPEDFFTSPSMTWGEADLNVENSTALLEDERVDYEVFDCDSTRVSGRSTQKIAVRNVNDAPSMNVSVTHYMVNSGLELDDETRAYVFSGGLEILDVDRDVDAVRVDVRSTYGLFTIDEEVRDLADFNSFAYCFSSQDWFCFGSGLDDTRMTFLATPSDAVKILQRVSYRGKIDDVDDVVKLAIYDGLDGGDCLAEHKLVSDWPTCDTASLEVTVHVRDFASGFKSTVGAGEKDRVVPWQAALTGVCVAIAVLCCLCACGCRWLASLSLKRDAVESRREKERLDFIMGKSPSSSSFEGATPMPSFSSSFFSSSSKKSWFSSSFSSTKKPTDGLYYDDEGNVIEEVYSPTSPTAMLEKNRHSSQDHIEEDAPDEEQESAPRAAKVGWLSKPTKLLHVPEGINEDAENDPKSSPPRNYKFFFKRLSGLFPKQQSSATFKIPDPPSPRELKTPSPPGFSNYRDNDLSVII